jgi:precorrin-6A/cobalt-precorrin-6A reductase
VRVLILGGTSEARAVAAALHDRPDLEFESSLAGRVSNPALPVGAVRIGGFGGTDGLVEYLRDRSVDAVLDATHPFAATITSNAIAACGRVGCALLVVRRPGWTEGPADRWHRVADIQRAAEVVAGLGDGTVLLTTGRRDLAVFAGDSRHHFVVRTVDPPSGAVPPKMMLLLDRGPYTVEGERALMLAHDVRALVSKDSGGAMTVAKLIAARELGVPVILVERPPVPDGVRIVDSVSDALRWVDDRA